MIRHDGKRPRIGFLTTELGPGGAEKVVYELARRLDPSRFEVAGVWCLRPADGYYAGELSRAGVPCSGAGMRWISSVPAGLLRLRRQLRAARLDLLNAHLFHASLAARLVARGAGIGSLVITHHFREERAWRYLAERSCPGKSAAVSAVAPGVAEAAAAGLHLDRSRVRLVPNGVDLQAIAERVPHDRSEARRQLRVPPEARVIGAVGRLSPEKDPFTLLEAFVRLARSDPTLHLTYVGDGTLHERLFKRIARLGLAPRARIVGFRPDVPLTLAALDVFVLASLTEGHPLALLEAMAAGLPVAASDIPAVREILGPDGRGALTFRPGDAAGLAERLGRLLADPELAASCGAAARELVAGRFTVERMVAGYESLFAEVLGL